MDYAAYQAINGLTGDTFVDGLFVVLANELPVVVVVVVAALFLWPLGTEREPRRRGAVSATAAASFGLLINQPIGHLVNRVRPYLAHPAHAHLLIARSHDPSFPSDHATGAFALATAVLFYNRRLGGALLVLGALLGFSRVYVGTHYPGDVLGGALIGIAAACVLQWGSLRESVERFADGCSSLYERLSARLSGQPS